MDTKLPVAMSDDIATLIEILRSIDEILEWIVLRSGLIQEEFQILFTRVWADTHARIGRAIEQLESVEEDDRLYEELETHGLTGDSLRLKFEIGSALGRRVGESAVRTDEGPRIKGFALKRLVKWINLILGSLAKVLPVLGAVKEYKESVELAVEDRQSEPVWKLPSILGL
jgi:hypothetical protein